MVAFACPVFIDVIVQNMNSRGLCLTVAGSRGNTYWGLPRWRTPKPSNQLALYTSLLTCTPAVMRVSASGCCLILRLKVRDRSPIMDSSPFAMHYQQVEGA
jgi:hypothetical protein